MPERRKIFEAEDSDFGGRGLGAMEVCSSTEMGAQIMGAPGASHLGTRDRGPKTDRSRPPSVPVNALSMSRSLVSRSVLRFFRYRLLLLLLFLVSLRRMLLSTVFLCAL